MLKHWSESYNLTQIHKYTVLTVELGDQLTQPRNFSRKAEDKDEL